MRTKFIPFLLCLLLLVAPFSRAQTLNLPARAANAPTGTQFITIITNMSQTARENWILAQVAQGNIPSWMRNLVPITITKTINSTSHTLTYYALADYLSIGSDSDYFQEPMTPILAQRIANLTQCTLPTRLMVNQIWTNSTVKMTANTFSPSTYDIMAVSTFVLENAANKSERSTTTNAHPLGALVSGDKKDLIVSTLIYNNLQTGVPKPVVIYGWIQPGGSPIQGEVNVHAESYMDYSHGTRLVQMAVTLDGSPNTVTNILTDSTLWPLLSDEGGTISPPYYTVDNTIAPFIITQPISQNVKPGSTAQLGVYAIADPTLTYQWKLNGANISNATNATLFITNAQAANAGTYTVVLTNPYGTVTNLPAILRVNTNAFALLFNDSLSADTSSNWTVLAATADYTTNWAYDYGNTPYTWNGSTYLIPPAPNNTNGSTRAVRLTVNNSTGVITGVNLYPKNQSFSNNFALKFDMWLNYPGAANGVGGTGTTEYAICGINHTGTVVNWAAAAAPPFTDGMWFAVDGEGGSTRDYRDYLGNPSGVQTDLSGSVSGLVGTNHGFAPFPTLFPSSRFETAGVPGKNWVAGEIDQSNGVVTWKMDGTVVAQRSNSSAYTNGNIMIGYMDVFASIASPLSDAYLLFDNVRVEDWSFAPLTSPGFSVMPQSRSVFTGTNITFSVTATGSPTLTYQWTFNSTNISGATNSAYGLTAVQTTNAGTYAVLVSNSLGSAISAPAQLSVSILPFQFNSAATLPDGNVQLSFTGAIGSQYTVQVSSNLVNWQPLNTVTDAANPVTYTDTNAAAFNPRFYRLATSP